MGSLIVYTLLSNQNYQQTFLLLGIYAGVGFRMVPSVNRMLNALLQIKSHQYLFSELEGLAEFQQEKNGERIHSLTFNKTIELKNISFRYSDGATILDRVSLTVNKGDKIALVGKSGIGKTTLLMLLLQFIKTNSGKILLDGVEVGEENLSEWRKIFSYVSQSPYILDGTIAENIAFGFPPQEIDEEKIQRLIS